ncbi:MAG TPA: 4Fe-4S dicluster domain-containing protein [Chroococcales cyanobacterium]
MLTMLKNAVLNLVKPSATINYPFTPIPSTKEARGALKIDGPLCIFCGLCSKACPAQAIQVSRADKHWVVDPYQCVNCGACVDVCPKKCLGFEEKYTAAAQKKSRVEFNG